MYDIHRRLQAINPENSIPLTYPRTPWYASTRFPDPPLVLRYFVIMKEKNVQPDSSNPRILVFTGDGKGKTTAAMGMALRATGHAIPTRILQFLKCDDTTGELAACKTCPHVEIQQVGKGFVPKPDHPKFACHRSAAEHGLLLATEAIQSGTYGLIVLDEICTAVSLGLLAEAAVVGLLKQARGDTIIALTGRGAPPSIIEQADTVTEMRCIKHGMHTGHKAQKGCEF